MHIDNYSYINFSFSLYLSDIQHHGSKSIAREIKSFCEAWRDKSFSQSSGIYEQKHEIMPNHEYVSMGRGNSKCSKSRLRISTVDRIFDVKIFSKAIRFSATYTYDNSDSSVTLKVKILKGGEFLTRNVIINLKYSCDGITGHFRSGVS